MISYASSPIDSSNIELAVHAQNGSNMISVTARDETGETLNSFDMTANIVSQNGQPRTLVLEQTGTGKYQGQIDTLEPGSYTISVLGKKSDADESIFETFGWSQSYSPEYLPVQVQSTPAEPAINLLPAINDPSQIFDHNLDVSHSIQAVWKQLLTVAAILLTLDIAVRRLKISNKDVLSGWEWIRTSLYPMSVSTQPGSISAKRVSTLLEIKQQRQKNMPSIHIGEYQTKRPLIQPELAVGSRDKSKAEGSTSSDRTVSILLSKKRERKKEA